MVLELRDLEWFLAIVDEGTFGRAAEALRVSQPSLSRRIAALESKLAVALFSRARRQVELTPAGRALAREARGVLAEARTAVDVARSAAHGKSGHLRIAYRSAFRYRILPLAMHMMLASDPDVAITVSGGSVHEILDRVRSREVDLGLVIAPVTPDDLAVDVLQRSPVVVSLPDGHRFARRKVIDVHDLAGEPFVNVGEKDVAGYADVVRLICAQGGFTPRMVVQVDSADLLLACVAAGIGIALIYGDNDIPIAGVTYHALRPAGPELQFFGAHRRSNDNPALPKFLEFVRRAATT